MGHFYRNRKQKYAEKVEFFYGMKRVWKATKNRMRIADRTSRISTVAYSVHLQ